MAYPKYTPSSQMPVKRDLSADSIQKLKRKRSKAFWQSVAQYTPHLKTAGFILLVLLLLFIAVNRLSYLFFKTSYFEIKEIEVIGNSYFSDEYVIKKAGLAPAMNIFSINRKEVTEKLLKEPRIKDANIEFEGMYKVKLQITERKPKVYVKTGLAFYEVSDDGVVINTEGMGEKDLPIITGIDSKGAEAGDSLLKNDNFFLAKKWLDSLDVDIIENLSEINFYSIQNPYVILYTGEKIYPKNLEDFKNRYDFLLTLLDNLRKNNVEPFYLDMRGDHFVVRPQKTVGS